MKRQTQESMRADRINSWSGSLIRTMSYSIYLLAKSDHKQAMKHLSLVIKQIDRLSKAVDGVEDGEW